MRVWCGSRDAERPSPYNDGRQTLVPEAAMPVDQLVQLHGATPGRRAAGPPSRRAAERAPPGTRPSAPLPYLWAVPIKDRRDPTAGAGFVTAAAARARRTLQRAGASGRLYAHAAHRLLTLQPTPKKRGFVADCDFSGGPA